jgi:hypothetical protein
VATKLPSALWEALNTRATMATARGSVVVRAWASGGQTDVEHNRYFCYSSDISDRGIQVIFARAGAEHPGWGKRMDRFHYIASGNDRFI